MQVASLELCKELYELSGWLLDDQCVNSSCTHHAYYNNGVFIAPKYHLGYLLRKLPVLEEGAYIVKPHYEDGKIIWHAWEIEEGVYGSDGNDILADTPEDAACKLAIELLKQKILKKE